MQPGTGEGTLIERADGSILYNFRAYFGDRKRYLAVSTDSGASYGEFTTDPFLLEEKCIGCNASMLRTERSMLPEHQRAWLPEQASAITLFSNPRAEERRNMTLCVSFDDGKSWAHTKCVREGPSGYSSLAYTAFDGHFYLLYELGEQKSTNQGLTIAEFDLEWLLADS